MPGGGETERDHSLDGGGYGGHSLSGDGGTRSSGPTGSSRGSGAGNNSAASGQGGGGTHASEHERDSSLGGGGGAGSNAGANSSRGQDSGSGGRATSHSQATGARDSGSSGVNSARGDTPSSAHPTGRSLGTPTGFGGAIGEAGRQTTSSLGAAKTATGIDPNIDPTRFGRAPTSTINRERFAPGVTAPATTPNTTNALETIGKAPPGTFAEGVPGFVTRPNINSRALSIALGALERTSPRGSRMANLEPGARPEPATGMSFPATSPALAATTATPTGLAPTPTPFASPRTRMQSVTRPGQEAPTARATGPAIDSPLAGRTRMDAVPRSISSPVASVDERMGVPPTAPEQATAQRFTPTGFGSVADVGINPDDFTAGIHAENYRENEAAALSAANEGRADLAQAARASENASMTNYNNAAAQSALSGQVTSMAEEKTRQEAQSIRDLGALYQSYKDAVGQIETGHKKDQYGTIGPYSQKYKANVYGKYQVLGTNIGPWTQEVLGQELTPKEFLASPAAQEAVFEDKFIGEYVAKYGLEGALQAWHGGPGSVGNPNAASPYKSNSDYVREAMANFDAAYERNIAKAEYTDYRPDRAPGSIDDRPATDDEGAPVADDDTTVPTAPTEDAATTRAPQPTDTVNPTLSLPNRAPIPRPKGWEYKRDASGFAKALGIDAMVSLTGPVGLAANALSYVFFGDSVGGVFADASEGKYGMNYYQPGDPYDPKTGYGGMRERGAGGYGSSTESRSGSVNHPVTTGSTTPSSTPADDFIEKYLDPDLTKRPTPQEKFWTDRATYGAREYR